MIEQSIINDQLSITNRGIWNKLPLERGGDKMGNKEGVLYYENVDDRGLMKIQERCPQAYRVTKYIVQNDEILDDFESFLC